MKRFRSIRRWLARLADNRVLAPRAYIVTDQATGAKMAYVPEAWIGGVETRSLAMSDAFGMPVRVLSARFDRRDREQEWREHA